MTENKKKGLRITAIDKIYIECETEGGGQARLVFEGVEDETCKLRMIENYGEISFTYEDFLIQNQPPYRSSKEDDNHENQKEIGSN